MLSALEEDSGLAEQSRAGFSWEMRDCIATSSLPSHRICTVYAAVWHLRSISTQTPMILLNHTFKSGLMISHLGSAWVPYH